jgi:hypothetical protein
VRVARFRRDVRAIVTSEETSTEIRTQTDRAFMTIKDSLVEAMNHPRSFPADLADNPPGKQQAANKLRIAISDYLIPQAQRVCATYNIDSTKFGISLKLPQLFTADLVNRIATAASFGVSKDTFGYAAARMAGHGVKETWAWVWGKPRPDGGWLAAAAATGIIMGVEFAAEAGANMYQRRRAIAEQRRAELPPEAVEQIVADTLGAVSNLMEERANSVERFVT